jgi:hypothetical protein
VIGGEPFSIDFYNLDLDSYMVLGAQWLESMGPILLEQPPRALDGGVHFSTGDAARGVDQPHGRAPQQLRALFTKPLGLPPQRSRCHRIRLLPDTVPVAVRPYQYAHTQKTELERQCVDMLRLGIIRHNSSAFSAPVLVKKADSSWRFCVDYRALNACTVKDKFPIPVVEELFNELSHGMFFTKLNLRSGYHMVRMHPDGVEKMMFQTHQGIFEFLVMLFGLTNAPVTF